METDITFTQGPIEYARYLGNFDVVSGLVRQFVGESMASECDKDVVLPAAAHLGVVFSGGHLKYRPIPGFRSMETMGRDIERYLNVPNPGSDLLMLIAAAAVGLISDIIAAVNADRGMEWTKRRTDWLIDRFIAVLLGNGAGMPPFNTAQVLHTKLDHHDKPVTISKPDTPSDQDAWLDLARVAIATPACALPDRIGDVPVQPWDDAPKTAAGWEALVTGLEFSEPPMPKVPGKKPAAGAVVIEPDGRVWLVAPTNQYGGYVRTFPKGKLDGMSPHATAIKEAWEESGLQVRLTGYLCDSQRSTSVTRYYLAHRIGGSPADMGWESQAVLLVPAAKLAKYATHPNDAAIVKAVLQHLKNKET